MSVHEKCCVEAALGSASLLCLGQARNVRSKFGHFVPFKVAVGSGRGGGSEAGDGSDNMTASVTRGHSWDLLAPANTNYIHPSDRL